MKNAILFHGTGGSPDAFWLPWLKQQLEQHGYQVWLPQLPDADHPSVDTWLPFAQQGAYTDDTIIVGHSAGCPLALNVLQHLTQPVAKVFLVAGYARPLPKAPTEILTNFDWLAIQRNTKQLLCIHSDNDPWGCSAEEGKYIAERTGGKLLILPGQGHFGSDTFNQPYREFPALLNLILR